MTTSAPAEALRPADATELQDVVRDAAAANRPLAATAGGTRVRLGRAGEPATAVDLSRLTGVVTYEPEELILIARPATPLSEVESLLAERGQHLAFEPPRWGAAATLGGALACGWAGPRRFRAGSARDFVLGVELVDGRGRRVRAGGRVVKNVTGYDLWRATVGAYGTLGLWTEVCLKLWPRPETQRTVVVDGLPRPEAARRLLAWSRRPEEITGLACEPGGSLLARIEGPARAVDAQVDGLLAEAAGAGAAGAVETLDAGASARRWAALRDADACRAADGEALWRLAVPPSRGHVTIELLQALGLRRVSLDWAGGLLWAVLPAGADAAAVHAVAVDCDGVAARLATGPDDANPHAFTPLSPGVRRLNETLRRTFDPQGLLNPGRMYAPT